MKEELYKLVDSYKEEMLEELEKFIAIPSVSSDLPQVGRALDFALELGRSMGFKAESLLEGQVGVIEMGEGDETLGILAHVDVVPAGDLSDWETEPFKMVIKDGRAYGRGTLDDKGMIIASLYAMKAAKELGLPMHKKTQLIMGTQEEVEWTDMDAYVAKCPLPDYGFTPDGEYPICNIEKGGLDLEMVFDIAEEDPEGRAVSSCDIGVASNTVPGRAACVLTDGSRIEATGKAVHSCQPEKGDNAIFRLVEQLDKEDLAENKLLRLFRAIKEDLSDPFGKKLGLYSDSEYYQGEFVHRNAFSPTILRTEGDKAILNVNIRFAYGTEPEEIKEKFQEWAKGLGGSIRSSHCLPAVFVSKEKPFLKVFAEAYENATGLKNEYTLAYGGSYAKAMPNVVSWGPILPGEEDTCHEPNEYLVIDTFVKSAKIFAESIARIATDKDSYK